MICISRNCGKSGKERCKNDTTQYSNYCQSCRERQEAERKVTADQIAALSRKGDLREMILAILIVCVAILSAFVALSAKCP